MIKLPPLPQIEPLHLVQQPIALRDSTMALIIPPRPSRPGLGKVGQSVRLMANWYSVSDPFDISNVLLRTDT
jgi:hypothetical protein